MRLTDTANGGDLVHQHFVDMQAAGGIQDDHIVAAETTGLHRAFRNINRLLAVDDRQGGDIGLFTQDRQLLLRGRAIDIERRH